MTREQSVNRLFVLWAILAVPPLALLMLQTFNGKYGEDAEIAWSWLLMQIMPIAAVLMAAAFSNPSRAWRRKAADPFRWRCALLSSLVLGASITGLMLAEPVIASSPFELFGASTIGLSLIQGVTLAALGSVIFDGR